ncbi:MAG TPA: serine hydrolase domain-containing protein [Fimbriimonadaceae bacterium]|jgi:CubicO group peptidase (beta-lactamase class C family)
MLRFLVISAVVTCLVCSALADPVDDFVRKEMASQHIPGLTIGVLVNDKLVKIKGYGFANLECSTPAKPETVYEIGSITKQFTAESIMMLVEQGKIGLDDKISKYISGTPDTWKDITVRNLLNHVSGIKNCTGLLGFLTEMQKNSDHDVFMKLVSAEPLEFAPGTKWEYSNSNFYLLGMIIEKVSGQSYGAFLQTHIFDPLGMKTAYLNDPTHVVAGRAAGYSWSGKGWENAQYVSMSWPYAAGALMMSVEDYAKWLDALDSQKLLKPSSYEAMYTPVKLANGEPQEYGFGWAIDTYRQHPRIWHNGGIPGFITEAKRFPKDNLSVIVFTNSGTCDPGEIVDGIGGLYVPALKPSSMLAPSKDPDPAFTKSLLDLVAHFAKGDSNMPQATEELKNQLNRNTTAIAKDMVDHLKEIQFLLTETDAKGGKRIYYRVIRTDGDQMFTVDENPDGKISSLMLTKSIAH